MRLIGIDSDIAWVSLMLTDMQFVACFETGLPYLTSYRDGGGGKFCHCFKLHFWSYSAHSVGLHCVITYF